MTRRKIGIAEFVNDVRGGMSDAALGAKYHLSKRQLEKLYDKLLKAGKLRPSDLDDAAPSFEPTVELAFTCAKCGALKLIDSDKCPQCGDAGLPSEQQPPEETPPDEETPVEPVQEAKEEPDEVLHTQTEDGIEPTAVETAIEEEQPEEDFTLEHGPEEPPRFQEERVSDSGSFKIDLSPPSESPKSEPRSGGRSIGLPVAIATLVVLAAAAGAGLYTGIIPSPNLNVLPFMSETPPPRVKTTRKQIQPEEQQKRSVADRPVRVESRQESRPAPSTAPQAEQVQEERAPEGKRRAPTRAAKTAEPKEKAVPAPVAKTEQGTQPARPVAVSTPEKEEVRPEASPEPARTEPAKRPEPVVPSVTREPAGPQVAAKVESTEAPKKVVSEAVPTTPERARPTGDSKLALQSGKPPGKPVEPVPWGKPVRKTQMRETPTTVPVPQPPKTAARVRSRQVEEEKTGTYDSAPDLNRRILEAARKGSAREVRRLLRMGADPDARDRDGATALMLASGAGHHAVVRILLENGADVELTDDKGATALAWAYGGTGGSLSDQRRVVRLLKEHGAVPVGAGASRQ